jgi:hypothetical protein
VDYYCSSHRLNLVIQKSLQSVPDIIDSINDASDIGACINGSHNRVLHLRNVQLRMNKSVKQILQPTPIRWSSTYNCINSVTSQYLPILTFLYEDFQNYPSKKNAGLLERVTSVQFITRLSIANVIFEKLNIILKFQKENVDIGCVKNDILRTLSSPKIKEEVKHLFYS